MVGSGGQYPDACFGSGGRAESPDPAEPVRGAPMSLQNHLAQLSDLWDQIAGGFVNWLWTRRTCHTQNASPYLKVPLQVCNKQSRKQNPVYRGALVRVSLALGYT